MRTRGTPLPPPFVVLALLAACSVQDVARRGDTSQTTTSARLGGWRPDAWVAPVLDSLPDSPVSRSIRRGRALFIHTRDSLPGFVPSSLNCSSCHLQEGRRPGAIPLFGVYGLYPRYIARADAVVPIEDRINYCMTRSLAGWKLASDSREMQDMVSYMAFLSRDIPGGAEAIPIIIPRMPNLTGDSARGATMFAESCGRCHGPDGQGSVVAPPLWGPKSFSVGASMARTERAAAFIRHNMPLDKPGSLNDQDSYDIAAYVTSLPRPDMPGKELDWPKGDAPSDVPYSTPGRTATKTPKLFPRANPTRAIVSPPKSSQPPGRQ
jgi:thiosulfate dehydrogenase